MTTITIVNFSHPITEEQRAGILAALAADDLGIIDVITHFDPAQPYGPQAEALVVSARLTPDQWQTTPIVVNLPSFNVIAALVLARLHGLMGHFPAIVRLRPVDGAIPPRFEFAELIDLNHHRIRAASDSR